MYEQEQIFVTQFWAALNGSASQLANIVFEDIPGGLPSRFHVSALASASVACATLAASELWAERTQSSTKKVRINCQHAGASFLSDRIAKPIGWELENDANDFTGNYATTDGWIRLHVGYAHHRQAVLAVLGTKCDRKEIAASVAKWKKDELESKIVSAGGCAAALNSEEDWLKTPQALAVKCEPIFNFRGKRSISSNVKHTRLAEKPLSGIRVLDLTRVLAGPIGSRFLAAYGADVLRIDPPHFYEPNSLLIETTRGKNTAILNLKSSTGSETFDQLIRSADIIIHGYRPGAMENLGYDSQKLNALNPGLLVIRHNAYGWSGPWRDRRGFDSLVQMSTGIASPIKGQSPEPLPAQALDYATGYLIATAACKGLTMNCQEIILSLAKTADCLMSAGKNTRTESSQFLDRDRFMQTNPSEWGQVKQLGCPGMIEGCSPHWTSGAVGLGHKQITEASTDQFWTLT